MNLTRKLIKSHLVSGDMIPGEEIALRIDQTLSQDATGTLSYLQFEAIGVPREMLPRICSSSRQIRRGSSTRSSAWR